MSEIDQIIFEERSQETVCLSVPNPLQHFHPTIFRFFRAIYSLLCFSFSALNPLPLWAPPIFNFFPCYISSLLFLFSFSFFAPTYLWGKNNCCILKYNDLIGYILLGLRTRLSAWLNQTTLFSQVRIWNIYNEKKIGLVIRKNYTYCNIKYFFARKFSCNTRILFRVTFFFLTQHSQDSSVQARLGNCRGSNKTEKRTNRLLHIQENIPTTYMYIKITNKYLFLYIYDF